MPTKTRVKEYKLALPFGLGEVVWEEDPSERRAAWALYVELVTRVAVQPLDLDEGLVREALSSLHSLFPTTREILKAAGPEVGAGRDTVGGIAIAVLTRGVAPFLSRWHPRLQAWEERRAVGGGVKAHERAWAEEPTLRGELEALRRGLETYADALAVIAGVDRA